MIVVVTQQELNERTGRLTLIVSHGIEVESGRPVTLPQVHPEQLGAVVDPEVGEYVLPERRH